MSDNKADQIERDILQQVSCAAKEVFGLKALAHSRHEESQEVKAFKTYVNAAIARTERLIKERYDEGSATNMVLTQMARNSTLLPEALETAILRGATPSLEAIVTTS